MNQIKDGFDIPELPGEELIIFYTNNEITFSGKQPGQSITANPNSVVILEEQI